MRHWLAWHWSAERLIDEIELLGARGLPREEFFAELAPRLRRVIDNDASCWHTLDPHTRLMTSDSPDELIERGVFTPETGPRPPGELIVRSEYLVEDVNTFAGLAARRVPVGILDHVTRGDPQRSARYRDLLLPADIPHELRAAFVIRGRVWGAVHIARRAASGAVRSSATPTRSPRVAGAIARGIRASLRFDAARRVTGVEAPGLVVLGPRRRGRAHHAAGPRAARLDAPRRDRVRRRGVARRRARARVVRARRAATAASGGSNVVTVPERATAGSRCTRRCPERPGDGRVAVVIERAAGAALGDRPPRGVRRDRRASARSPRSSPAA